MKRRFPALASSLVILSLGCQGDQPAHYPAGVPSYAVWAGGEDGGAYISCTANLPRNANYCRVWNDYTGELVESGDYQVKMQRRGTTQKELKFLGASQNGEIYLQNGLALQLLAKPHK